MQEEKQAIGRFVRPGQKEHAIAYRVIALGTADVTMISQASAKDLALDAFMGLESKFNILYTPLQHIDML